MKTLTRSMMVAVSAVMACSVVAEEIPGTGKSMHLESAQIVGTGRSINMHRVPIKDITSGDTAYYDVSATFSIDVNGLPSFDTITSVAVSAPLSYENFLPGTYVGGKGKIYVLSGPAHVGGTRTSWALACVDCQGATSMSWTTGSPTGHPDIGTRPIAAELSPGFSYGVMGESSGFIRSDEFSAPFNEGYLIGARQAGNTVTVSLFNERGDDMSSPTSSVSLRMQQ